VFENIKQIAQDNGWELTENAERIASFLKRQAEKYGKPYCPCTTIRTEQTVCPCKTMREKGVCHCGLFKPAEKN